MCSLGKKLSLWRNSENCIPCNNQSSCACISQFVRWTRTSISPPKTTDLSRGSALRKACGSCISTRTYSWTVDLYGNIDQAIRSAVPSETRRPAVGVKGWQNILHEQAVGQGVESLTLVGPRGRARCGRGENSCQACRESRVRFRHGCRGVTGLQVVISQVKRRVLRKKVGQNGKRMKKVGLYEARAQPRSMQTTSQTPGVTGASLSSNPAEWSPCH